MTITTKTIAIIKTITITTIREIMITIKIPANF